MLIGVIADDFTGASDIAITLSKGLTGEGGLETTQYLGVPDAPAAGQVEAGVIALKSRSIPADEAVAQSLAACRWLQAQGCQQIVFKYCSTFDSTDAGNIGPVTDALAAHLGAQQVVVCPAFPAMGRTVYQGHLFVHDRLLSESGMEHHPLTPMTDANLRRVLQRQSRNPVAHIGWQTVVQGRQALRDAFAAARQQNSDTTLLIVDAISEQDLTVIGRACEGAPLVTGGSGIALALPHNFIARGQAKGQRASVPPIDGPEAILVGSCSGATREQIAEHQKKHPVMMIEVADVLSGKTVPDHLVAFIQAHQGEAPLIYSSGDPQTVKAIQQQYGREKVAAALDSLFGTTARQLIDAGVRRLVVGGGETSGAVVSALNLSALTIGEEIDTGVPAMISQGEAPIALALKSGNFGGKDFFARAVATLRGGIA
ncbi:3-oxo-tetronate kinase [Winslowiella iniecta]|uniref:3-oxo-tetronate kinase n=1 Tax=Winslowiella iniecta TaxID=1560201 RepID=A0A0L7T5G3_9GAMM|nr:3-oxo-tetronate kinase [Winslowiella iniecta]KOC90649.1 membrane protein [Winslowiella iniecta]KOC93077.1 membrane protein [Winslowiella iniecta]